MTNRIEVGRKWLVGVTLAVTPALVAATGLDISLTDQETIAVSPALIDASGRDVALIDAEPIAVSPALVAASGQMVEITEADEIGVSPSVVTLVGLDVTLIDIEPIAVTPSVVNVTGLNAALSDQAPINVTTGVVAAVGLDVTLTDAEPINVTVAIVAAVGQNADLTDDATIAVSPATVGVTGLNASIGGDIPVTAGVVGVTGLDVLIGGTIPVTAGVVGVTSVDVPLSDTETIAVSPATVGVTGLNADLIEAETIDVIAGVVGVSAFEISLTDAEPIDVTAAIVAAVGQTVSLTANVANITIVLAGPQAANGDIPIEYTITVDDPTVEVIAFEASAADPDDPNDFGGSGAPTYIDLGTANMTTTGSGIDVNIPDNLGGDYQFGFLPTNGGASDITITGDVTVTSTVIDVTAGTVAAIGLNADLTEGAIIDVTAGTVAATGLSVDLTESEVIDVTAGIVAVVGQNVDLTTPSSGVTDDFSGYTVGQALDAQTNYSAWAEMDGGTGTLDVVSGDAIEMDAIDSDDGVEWDGVDPGSDDTYLELDVEIVDQASGNTTRIRAAIGDVEFRAIGTGSVQMRQPIGGPVLDSDSVTWTGATQQTLRFERDVTNSQCRQLLDGVQETIETGMTFGAGATDRVWKFGIGISDSHAAGDIRIVEVRTGAL